MISNPPTDVVQGEQLHLCRPLAKTHPHDVNTVALGGPKCAESSDGMAKDARDLGFGSYLGMASLAFFAQELP